jgi:hypothetical protein
MLKLTDISEVNPATIMDVGGITHLSTDVQIKNENMPLLTRRLLNFKCIPRYPSSIITGRVDIKFQEYKTRLKRHKLYRNT